MSELYLFWILISFLNPNFFEPQNPFFFLNFIVSKFRRVMFSVRNNIRSSLNMTIFQILGFQFSYRNYYKFHKKSQKTLISTKFSKIDYFLDYPFFTQNTAKLLCMISVIHFQYLNTLFDRKVSFLKYAPLFVLICFCLGFRGFGIQLVGVFMVIFFSFLKQHNILPFLRLLRLLIF